MTKEKRTRLIKHLKYSRSIGADYLITDEDADEIIKALEQEPILDKIKEQIELEKLGYPPSAGYYKAIVKVLQIIDKYKGNKAESENKEIHSVIDGDFFKGI